MPAVVTACPDQLQLDVPTKGPVPPPSAESLAYSLTLPAGLASPAVARQAAKAILRAHDLLDVTDAAAQVLGELTACACRFTPTAEVYVSLRYRDGALRVIVYDGHPRHTNPRLAANCDTRHRAALRVLACVVRACGGEWGFGDARQPGGGTRMWAVLPRQGARGYGQPPG
ncbi:ATP-binding protein [Streptomyces sp. NPDC050658]|uniref:ATP-binding protein n=1 Tax=unclassified Streptomyces TaxID=2593676 RepID=UPI003422BCED